MDAPAVLLTLQQLQDLITGVTHLKMLVRQNQELIRRVDALHGLYSQLLMKVADIERSL